MARNFIRRTQPHREPPTRPNWSLQDNGNPAGGDENGATKEAQKTEKVEIEVTVTSEHTHRNMVLPDFGLNREWVALDTGVRFMGVGSLSKNPVPPLVLPTEPN